MPSDIFVSVVIPLCAPLYGATANTLQVVENALQQVVTHYLDYEIILIDDHLDPASEDALSQLLSRSTGVRVIRLNQPHGLGAAISVGVDHSIGDYVVVFHPDQDPAEMIPQIVKLCSERADIAYGIDEKHRKRNGVAALLSAGYHWYLDKFTDLKVPRYATSLRCMSRKAVLALKTTDHGSHQIQYSRALSQLKAVAFPYSAKLVPRNNKDASLSGAVSQGAVAIVENSTHPLQMVRQVGLGLALLAGVMFTYLSWQTLFGSPQSAIAPLVLIVTIFILLCILLLIAVLSEYMLRIFNLVQPKPKIMIEHDKRSGKMLSRDRLNVFLKGFGND